MNLPIISKYIGRILQIEALFMLPALGIAIFQRELAAIKGFIIAILLTFAFGFLLSLVKPKETRFFAREGFATVAFSWVMISIFGAIPFVVSGSIPSFIDALFETVSGFTTTGSTILTDVEVLPMSVTYWRSFTHWLGGMGVLVFMLAVVPLGGEGKGLMRVMRAESPGPIVGKLVPKLHATAKILYAIYIALTLVMMILLVAFGMPLFDSVNTAIATAGTGGFAIKNASIGAYDSYLIQGTVAVFMILFGVNFNIYYLILMREFRQAYKNEEVRLYLGVVAAATILIALNIAGSFGSFFDALHHSFFQVASIISTTGFATQNFDLWPQFSRFLLCLLTIFGACAGSTAGGFKIARVLILWKAMRTQISRMLHPQSVRAVRVDEKAIDDKLIREVSSYLFVYISLTLVSMLVISLDNMSFTTTVTSVLTCINNVGPGLEIVGPIGNFSTFSVLSKIVFILDMLIGRLEIFPILLLFTHSAWKRTK